MLIETAVDVSNDGTSVIMTFENLTTQYLYIIPLSFSRNDQLYIFHWFIDPTKFHPIALVLYRDKEQKIN